MLYYSEIVKFNHEIFTLLFLLLLLFSILAFVLQYANIYRSAQTLRNIANGLRDYDKLALDELSIICSDQISSSKEIHFKNLVKKLNDPALGPKAFWSILNGFLGKTKIREQKLVNGSFEINFLNKANIFNNYFSKQCNIFDNGSIFPEVSFRTNKRLNHLEINGNDILKVIKDLNPNKAHGWDEISIRMIKLCGNTLVTPLLIILETALET